MTQAQKSLATDTVIAVQRAVAEIQDEAIALALSIQITMDLLRTVDPAERGRIGEALVRIAINRLSAEEIQDPRPAAAG